MKTTYLKINAADNVAVAIEPLKTGEQITVDGIVINVNEDIPAGHKIALKDFAEGETSSNMDTP
jgi:altronate hydrolase